jgi:hypothetical protein
MNLQGIVFKPTSATFREVRRFSNLRDAENAFVERTRLFLPARGHRQLNMIKCQYSHGLQTRTFTVATRRREAAAVY